MYLYNKATTKGDYLMWLRKKRNIQWESFCKSKSLHTLMTNHPYPDDKSPLPWWQSTLTLMTNHLHPDHRAPSPWWQITLTLMTNHPYPDDKLLCNEQYVRSDVSMSCCCWWGRWWGQRWWEVRGEGAGGWHCQTVVLLEDKHKLSHSYDFPQVQRGVP